MATDGTTTTASRRSHRPETDELTRHLWLVMAKSYGQPVRIFP